jgi:hypothetical protein
MPFLPIYTPIDNRNIGSGSGVLPNAAKRKALQHSRDGGDTLSCKKTTKNKCADTVQ